MRKDKIKKYLFKNISIIFVLFIGSIGFMSCEDFLDAKPDPSMTVPSTLEDCQLLLDNYTVFNRNRGVAELASDDYFLSYSDWEGLSKQSEREAYIWDPDCELSPGDWDYRPIFYSNIVLELLSDINPNDDPDTYKEIKGTALFCRAYNFYRIAQIFTLPYNESMADTDLGIPLRLSADVNEKSVRSSVRQTYNQIISDLETAVELLPETVIQKTRPNKAAGYAQLAVVYLTLGNYDKSGEYADKCLQLYNELIDYNTLSTTHSTPLKKYNDEVIYHTDTDVPVSFFYALAKVDTNLLKLYDVNDLRFKIFFRYENASGKYILKGSYAGSKLYLFTGLAVDEMYLIRAECFARNGKISDALADLNTLLEHRCVENTFIPISSSNAREVLDIIISERRKELVYRTIRWSDLRRFNNEPEYRKTLKRVLTGNAGEEYLYELPPNDLRYAFLIPKTVIQKANIEQNKR